MAGFGAGSGRGNRIPLRCLLRDGGAAIAHDQMIGVKNKRRHQGRRRSLLFSPLDEQRDSIDLIFRTARVARLGGTSKKEWAQHKVHFRHSLLYLTRRATRPSDFSLIDLFL
jgi:hypothetical protein